MTRRPGLILTLIMLVAGTAAAGPRWYTDTEVARGAALYARHCARCHGDRAQGGPAWPETGGGPREAAPPLDGHGHAWYHPMSYLVAYVRRGVPGGRCPAGQRARLTPGEARSIIAWFQARWPDAVYRRWSVIERRSGQR